MRKTTEKCPYHIQPKARGSLLLSKAIQQIYPHHPLLGLVDHTQQTVPSSKKHWGTLESGFQGVKYNRIRKISKRFWKLYRNGATRQNLTAASFTRRCLWLITQTKQWLQTDWHPCSSLFEIDQATIKTPAICSIGLIARGQVSVLFIPDYFQYHSPIWLFHSVALLLLQNKNGTWLLHTKTKLGFILGSFARLSLLCKDPRLLIGRMGTTQYAHWLQTSSCNRN